MFTTKNIILILAAVAAVVLVAAAAFNSGILKKPKSPQNSSPSATRSSNSSGAIETGGPVDGTYTFRGTLTSVKDVTGGTEITVEWPVNSKIEKRTVVVTSDTKVTEGSEQDPQPSSASKLKVGQTVVVEATLAAKTLTWTTHSVHIAK